MCVDVFLGEIISCRASDHEGAPAEPYGADRVHGDQQENVDVTNFGSDQLLYRQKLNLDHKLSAICKAKDQFWKLSVRAIMDDGLSWMISVFHIKDILTRMHRQTVKFPSISVLLCIHSLPLYTWPHLLF